MREKKFLAIVLCLALVQAAVAPSLKFFGVAPDLLLICVVIASLKMERSFAFLAAVSCGLLKDAFGIAGFGVYTFLYPSAFLVLLQISRTLVIDTAILTSAAVFCLSLALAGAERIVLGYLGFRIPVFVFLKIAVLQAAYTAVVVPLIGRLINRVARV
ncbi:MAG: rod shape-determining protein MreD [Candidatus Omnitrophica bacterium]|nr:rod shape-determining protein MreD [Candidatus Omnitrophota bacterium]